MSNITLKLLLFFVLFIISFAILYNLIMILLFPIRGFFKDMPKHIFKIGLYEAYTYKILLFKNGTKIYSKSKYKVLLFAYLKARYLAWQLDTKTIGEEHGVGWGIKNTIRR